jgi:uncharacterized membrane protein
VKGSVLGFDPESNTGAISGHDGQRYDFVRLEWRGTGRPPLRGDTVDFVADGQRARQIYPLGLVFDPQEGSLANVVYILYLLGLFLPFTSIVGVIIAYVNQGEAPEWLQSHYRFQIRTFWIGLLYGIIGLVTCIIIIGFFWLCFVLIWLIVRCVKGMQAISRGMPYDRPASWIW